MRAAIYTRVSTEEQADSGLGLAAQEERCRALCLAKGWNVAAVYCDDGVSGTIDLPYRKDAVLMLEACANGDIDVVVVLKLDRIARRAEWILRTIRELGEQDVMFHAVGESFDTSTAVGKMVVTVLAAFAEFERDLIAERTKAALAQLRKQGKLAGTLPYGFRRVETSSFDPSGVTKYRIVPDEHEQEGIARARAGFAAGLSLRKIARDLYVNGWAGKEGQELSAQAVKNIVDPKVPKVRKAA